MANTVKTRANAQQALDAYPADEPNEVGQSISDLIADLMHLADSLGLDGASLNDTATMHYVAERNGEDE